MGSRRLSKFNTALIHEYLRLSELSHSKGYTTEVRTSWMEIWLTYIDVDGPQSTHVDVDIAVVSVFAFLGWRIAAEDGDFVTALYRLERYFGHPDVGKSNPVDWVEASNYRAISLLYTGQEDAAIDLYRELLVHNTRSTRKCALSHARRHIYTYIIKRPQEDLASEEMRALVLSMAILVRAPKKLYRDLPTAATYGDLCQLVNQTYSSEIREKVRMFAKKSYF